MDLFTLTSIFLIGTAVSIPITYLFACLFHSILWATIVTIIILIGLVIKFRKRFKKIRIDWSSALLILFAFSFSTWMMFKTFHGSTDGQLFVGSNNIFDFGHSLGIVRSFSWGSNIPFMSPFQAGLPYFYHFIFYFWVAILEYFGMPVVWAMNIPSILSFSALIIIVYYLPQILVKQKPFVGWVTVLLTITNSSLTFWYLIGKKNIWQLPTYPYAGPFDGSIISIFITLNSYINQRHLAFATALGLLLLIFVYQKKNSLQVAVISGILFLWNTLLFLIVNVIIAGMYSLTKRWKDLFVYSSTTVLVVFMFVLPFIALLFKTLFFMGLLASNAVTSQLPGWTFGNYLWQNLGILPVIAAFGFMKLEHYQKKIFIPFVILFIALCALVAFGNRGFEQKTYSFVIIGVNLLAAVGLGYVWKKLKIVAIILLAIMTVSGFVDFMPIKNEFAYPLIGRDTVPVIRWIGSNTPRDAIFVSYSDMIDPVVLAGRFNYFGFFGNIGREDRSTDVKAIYLGNRELAKERGISYVLVPKWKKNDFPYEVQLDALPIVYEDARYRVYTVE